MLLYAITIFLSAFLLFQVQPLIGKYILPWFGGTPAVWTTCMMFFQVALLGGYAYTHATGRLLTSRRQSILHVVLLLASVAVLLNFPPADTWKPTGAEMPVGRILLLLLATIGAPYFLVATTSPLIQDWFARTHPGKSPYRLYALSNVGSLLALMSYPFLVEPALKLDVQCRMWSGGYIAFVALAIVCAVGIARRGKQVAHVDVEPDATVIPPETDEIAGTTPKTPFAKPTWFTVVLWLLLAACGSVVLLATTNQMCQEVAIVPFLWVVPLGLYLLTFILCFDSPRWYYRPVFAGLLVASAAIMVVLLEVGVSCPMSLQIVAYSATMFVLCMVCHGELVKLRPAPRHLTLFYLMVSLGGALGGVFVVVVATRFFDGYWEYHLGLALVWLLFMVTTFQDPRWVLYPFRRRAGGWHALVWVVWAALFAAFCTACVMLKRNVEEFREDVVASTRNFYGVLRVEQRKNQLVLMHGRIEHGFQFTWSEGRTWPTSYYAPPTGIGLLIDHHPRRLAGVPMRIGVVGLGTGTIAAWGERGDVIRYYEINPEVERLCLKYFTFVKDARERGAAVDIILGDARIQMEHELAAGEPQRLDVLAVDAFSSDAIPMHLLTLECADIYMKHLKPDGVLAIHVSNRFLDLEPVVLAIAEHTGLEPLLIDSLGNDDIGANASTWILLTNNPLVLDTDAIYDASIPFAEGIKPIAWTDDYGSLWQVLRKEDRGKIRKELREFWDDLWKEDKPPEKSD